MTYLSPANIQLATEPSLSNQEGSITDSANSSLDYFLSSNEDTVSIGHVISLDNNDLIRHESDSWLNFDDINNAGGSIDNLLNNYEVIDLVTTNDLDILSNDSFDIEIQRQKSIGRRSSIIEKKKIENWYLMKDTLNTNEVIYPPKTKFNVEHFTQFWQPANKLDLILVNTYTGDAPLLFHSNNNKKNITSIFKFTSKQINYINEVRNEF